MMTFINNHALALQIWFGAACTLGIYSILYKENRIYRFFEHMYLGLASGWAIRAAWVDVLYPSWWARMTEEGRWWWIFTLPFGVMLYMVYSKKNNWMSRISIGLLLGLDAGQQFQKFSGLYYKQISTTFKPLLPRPAEPAAGLMKDVTVSGAVNNWIFLAIIVCVMTYFFFSFEQKNKAIIKTASAGRWVLMCAFGAIFGSTIMARMALFIGRMDFLVHKFGGMIYPPLK